MQNIQLYFSRLRTQSKSGFTLIELLVVIAVIGVLAGITLVAVNPLEQLARGRDTNRVSAISGLGNSVNTYFATQGANPAQSTSWMDTMVATNDIRVQPSNPTGPTYTIGCNTVTAPDNGYCYLVSGATASVFARAESASNITKAGCTGVQQTWIVWSSAAGKTGLTCTTNSATDPANGLTSLSSL